jgi:hypothetical protein
MKPLFCSHPLSYIHINVDASCRLDPSAFEKNQKEEEKEKDHVLGATLCPCKGRTGIPQIWAPSGSDFC